MKIANWYGGRDFRIENAPRPRMKDDEALVAVKAASICGSEVHAYTGISKRREEIHGIPLVMGHEFAGVVEDVGENTTNVAIGDRVAVNPIVTCKKCEQCLTGRGNICRNFELLGLHVDGAFAEYVTIVGENCFKLSNDTSFQEASLCEPCSVAIHAVNITPIGLGDDVVVLGAGPIGLLTLQAARLAGAGRIFVTGTHDHTLDMAKKLGADEVINAKEEDVVQIVMKLTKGEGVDAVLEAVGTEKTLQQGLDLIKKGKTVTTMGMREKTMQLRMIDVSVKEARIQGDYGYTIPEFKSAIKLVSSNKLNLKTLITHEFALEDIAKAFELVAQRKDAVVKVVVKP